MEQNFITILTILFYFHSIQLYNYIKYRIFNKKETEMR